MPKFNRIFHKKERSTFTIASSITCNALVEIVVFSANGQKKKYTCEVEAGSVGDACVHKSSLLLLVSYGAIRRQIWIESPKIAYQLVLATTRPDLDSKEITSTFTDADNGIEKLKTHKLIRISRALGSEAFGQSPEKEGPDEQAMVLSRLVHLCSATSEEEGFEVVTAVTRESVLRSLSTEFGDDVYGKYREAIDRRLGQEGMLPDTKQLKTRPKLELRDMVEYAHWVQALFDSKAKGIGDSANGQPAIAAIQAAHIHAVFQYDFHRDRDVVKVHPGPLQAYGSNHIVEHLKECTNVDVFIGCCFCALCQPPVYSYNLDYSQRE
eukprot:m.34694 g.34694  ORF g.34694 m.34694 type:complete len:324 (+) comp14322_c0_seq7:243-1214(+)